MYSKAEKKQLITEFWTRLGEQMEKLKNPHGSKVSWMDYNTGIRDLYFRMEADEEGARLCIDLQFADRGVREVYYEQFLEFKDLLEQRFKSVQWFPEFEHSNGKVISRISVEKTGVNLYNRKDWDKMHLFLKLNFVKLDQFWDEFDAVFKQLK